MVNELNLNVHVVKDKVNTGSLRPRQKGKALLQTYWLITQKINALMSVIGPGQLPLHMLVLGNTYGSG